MGVLAGGVPGVVGFPSFMPVVVVEIARTPDACWRAFTDARLFPEWMPALRRADVISTNDDGLPHEVHFEFSESLSYSLVYDYDLEAREVRWEPRVGKRDAVRGSARIEPHGDGSRMTYQIAQGKGRVAGDLVKGSAPAVVAAFVRWIEARRLK